MRQIVAGLGFVALTGCSFVLVRGPAANHEQLPVVECTTSKLGPILDIIWTGLQASNLVLALAQSDAKWDEQFSPNEAPFSRKTAIGLYSGFAALGAAGIYYGFSRTSRCSAAKEAWIIRAQQGGQPGTAPQPGQPGTWPPPQQGPASGPQGPGTWPPPQQGSASGPQGPGTPPQQGPASGPQGPGTWPPPAQTPPAQTPPAPTPPAPTPPASVPPARPKT